MAREKAKNKGESPKLDMTPMIDVVFQLLIFFVVTLKQEDILSRLDAARPAPNPEPRPPDPNLISIVVSPQNYFAFNGVPMSLEQVDQTIARLARQSKTSMVTIRCTADSPHAKLVQVMDLCNKHGMTNIAIFSM